MALIFDLSKWDSRLLNYSLELITYGDIITYLDQTKRLEFSRDYKNTQQDWIKTKNPLIHVFWLSFSTGIECLSKAVLLKHESLTLSKRNILNKYPFEYQFNSREMLDAYKNDIYGSVYREASNKIIANTNEWLKQEFDDKGIVYNTEINTPTLGKIYNREFKTLLLKEIISEDELTILEKGLETLSDIRRNVDSHIFINNRVVGSIQKDLERVYLPCSNLLISIYYR